MPKQLYKIDQFHGGLNTHSDDRDIDDNQQADLEDVMVDSVGQIKMMGSTTSSIETANTTGITGTMKAGYGIHTFKSDYTGAEDKGSSEAASGDEYVAMYDGNDGHVWIYSAAEGDWDDDVSLSGGNGAFDLGNSNTSSVKPCFYSMEGGLRLSDGTHTSTNTSKWYGYIKRTLFESIGDTVSIDEWYSTDQAVSAPADVSQFDEDVSAYTITTGDYHQVTSIGATSNFISEDTLFDNGTGGDGSTLNMQGGIDVTVRITTTSYTGIPGESDFDVAFTLRTGSGTSSSWHGTLGTNNKETSASTMADTTSGATRDVTYSFSFGDDYSDGSAVGNDFGNGDTTNGIRTTMTVTSQGKNISSAQLLTVKITEASLSTNEHTDLEHSGIPSVHLEVNTGAAPGAGTASGWDSRWEHGVSFIYDGNQESLVRRLFDGSNSNATETNITNATYAPITHFYIEHGTNKNFNRRITGAVWYVKDVGGDSYSPWCAQIEYDFIKGVARVLSTGYETNVQYNAEIEEYEFAVDHEYLLSPNLVDTYQSRTGVSDTEKAIKASYSTATISGRRIYIGNVKIINEDGTTEVKGDAMLKSPPNKFDIFPATSAVEATINDGESIVRIETFADRILQFKEDTLYIINVSQDIEFLEDTHKHKGVKHPSMVCKTDYGIAWVNELGCYLYDGKQVHNLLEKGGKKLIDDDIWQTHVIESSASSSMIGYLPKKRQLIVVKSNAAVSNAGDIFLYDMVTQSWTFGDSKMTDSQLKSNFVVYQNDLIYMHTNATNDFVKWNSAVASSANFQIVTKDIDFGEPGRNKKIYKVLVTYDTGNATSNVQVDYDVNGGTSYPYDFADGTNFSSTELASANGWAVAELKPDVGSEANNIKSFKLRFATDNTVPSGFRINDISIIYRGKRPK